MPIENGGLKGDLAPKQPEESKLRGRLAGKKDEGVSSEPKLRGSLVEKTLEPAVPTPERFSRAWVEGRTFILDGQRFLAATESHERRGIIVILKSQDGMKATMNFDLPKFIDRLELGRWKVAE